MFTSSIPSSHYFQSSAWFWQVLVFWVDTSSTQSNRRKSALKYLKKKDENIDFSDQDDELISIRNYHILFISHFISLLHPKELSSTSVFLSSGSSAFFFSSFLASPQNHFSALPCFLPSKHQKNDSASGSPSPQRRTIHQPVSSPALLSSFTS